MIQGIDLSHWDTGVDLSATKAGGWPFVYIKATEGLNQVDGLFSSYWSQAQASGMIRGAYHFFHPELDPKLQANFFLSTVGALSGTDLPPCLDLEVMNGMFAEDVVLNACVWMRVVAAGTGKTPVLYINNDMLVNQLNSDPRLAQYPLWFARYCPQMPAAPKPFKQITIWQNSESGTAPGCQNTVDTNYFNGTIEDLQEFCK